MQEGPSQRQSCGYLRSTRGAKRTAEGLSWWWLNRYVLLFSIEVKERGKAVRVTGLSVLLCLGAAWLPAQNLSEFEKKVTEFTLPNGLHFILVERHDAAVMAFHTYVKVGTVDDPAGQTGLANLVSRVLMKGTETLGTRGWEGEKRALDAAEQAYGRLQAERNKGLMADAGKAGVLDTQWRMALEAAQTWVDPNAYARVIQDNGGGDPNVKLVRYA